MADGTDSVKVFGGGEEGVECEDKAHYHLSLHHMAHQLPSPLSPIHLASHRKTVHCSQHGLSASKVSSSEPRPATDTSADLYFDKCNKESPIGNSNLTP